MKEAQMKKILNFLEKKLITNTQKASSSKKLLENMLKNTSLIAVGSGLVSFLMFAGVAAAAANPSGTGQPNQSCEESTTAPSGFSSDGFANAETKYAGSGKSVDHANSPNAVSQYDVACYQLISHQ